MCTLPVCSEEISKAKRDLNLVTNTPFCSSIDDTILSLLKNDIQNPRHALMLMKR